MSRFNSWVAGARVRFLPKETQQQPGIDPGHRNSVLRLPDRCPDHLRSYYFCVHCILYLLCPAIMSAVSTVSAMPTVSVVSAVTTMSAMSVVSAVSAI